MSYPLDEKLVELYNSPNPTLAEIEAAETPYHLLRFDNNVAFELGCLVRDIAKENFPGKFVIIDISLPSGHCIFRATTDNGSSLDNDIWIARKKKTVFRFNKSSFFMRHKKGDAIPDQRFFVSEKEYAFHGGAVPIYLENFNSPIACLTCSGLQQQQDHLLSVSSLKALKERQQSK